VIGLALFVGVFCAVGLAYACTEYAMTTLQVRQRLTRGEAGLKLILAVHGLSFTLTGISAFIVVAASGQRLYLQAAVIALGAQALWLTEQLGSYYRDQVRVRREHHQGLRQEVSKFKSQAGDDIPAASQTHLEPRYDLSKVEPRRGDDFVAEFESRLRMRDELAKIQSQQREEFLASQSRLRIHAELNKLESRQRDDFLASQSPLRLRDEPPKLESQPDGDFLPAARSLFSHLDELNRDPAKRPEIGVQGVALAGEHHPGERAGEHEMARFERDAV
jgi:hypothetical protein